jgi:phosphohistidine phosphatase
MLRLILMRHAKSDWDDPMLSDHDRPLNARGRRSAQALGDWMRTRGYLPEQVLCSSAVRTGETLKLLDLSPAPDARFTRKLYLAEPDVMMDVLNSATGKTVLMVGHNPGIAMMAERLVKAAPAHDRFHDYPTGATLVCDFDAPDWARAGWHQGKLVDFVIPRELVPA